jgi:hypothetical protein
MKRGVSIDSVDCERHAAAERDLGLRGKLPSSVRVEIPQGESPMETIIELLIQNNLRVAKKRCLYSAQT